MLGDRSPNTTYTWLMVRAAPRKTEGERASPCPASQCVRFAAGGSRAGVAGEEPEGLQSHPMAAPWAFTMDALPGTLLPRAHRKHSWQGAAPRWRTSLPGHTWFHAGATRASGGKERKRPASIRKSHREKQNLAAFQEPPGTVRIKGSSCPSM